MLLITGVNGYIGTHLGHRFRQQNVAVRGLVRARCEESQIGYLKSLGVDVVQGDLAQNELWTRAMAGVTRVAHLIGSVQPERGTSFHELHVGLAEKCVETARQAGVEKVVFVSAINAHPEGPSRYYRTKGLAEEVFRNCGVPYCIIRPALVYGRSVGTRHSKVMMKFFDMARHQARIKLVGTGENQVQPIHIADLVECCYQIILRDDCSGREFDLAGPRVMTMNELVGHIAGQCGCPDKPVTHIPPTVARVAAFFMERLSDTPLLTTDQLRSLNRPMLADPELVQREFGVMQRRFAMGLRDYEGKGIEHG